MEKAEKKTDRQERIPDFSQQTIREARIGVIGAGATGNEVLKNLALVGFGYVYCSDMDHISSSNISRTVLFTEKDIGKRKAVLAAERFQAMNIDNGVADYYDGDICHGLGDGVFRHLDIIIDCVDNDQTRLYVSNICQLIKKPSIDIGIGGFDWNVLPTSGQEGCACFACTLSQREEKNALSRVRNSCDVTRRKASAEKKIPTIVTAAASAGSLAVEKAIKIAFHLRDPENELYKPDYGVMSYYSSLKNKMSYFDFNIRRDCEHHDSYDANGGVIETPISAHWRLKDALAWAKENYGGDYEIAVYKDCACADRGFVTKAYCEHCGTEIDVYRPQPLEDDEMLCESCRSAGHEPTNLSNAVLKCSFSLLDEERIQNMTLLELGIPLLHIVEFSPLDEEHDTLFLELTGDIEEVMPHLPR